MAGEFFMTRTKSNHPKVEPLLRLLAQRLSRLAVNVFAPLPTKNGWVELTTPEGQEFIVECYVKDGYGLSSEVEGDEIGYGEGADEIFEEPEQVVARLEELITTKGKTEAAPLNFLRELRLKRGVTQEELANRLGIKQSTISRLERRQNNIELGTLQRYVNALGGQIELHATFPQVHGKVQGGQEEVIVMRQLA